MLGLALGGGAARGLAHIGVLELLEKEGIRVDMIAGTSAGALVGALALSGHSALELKEFVLGFDWTRRASLLDLSLRRAGLLAGRKITAELQKFMGGDLQFSQLTRPFACVACDIFTGEEIVMTKGSVLQSVRASISIPVVFTAVERQGRYLVDGGLVNQVPVDVVKAMGADVVIAVNVVPRHIHKVSHNLLEPEADPSVQNLPRPGMLAVMLNTLDIVSSCHVNASLEEADYVIEPDMLGIGPADFQHAADCILRGELAASDAVADIHRLLAE
jgi:NTE family protein